MKYPVTGMAALHRASATPVLRPRVVTTPRLCHPETSKVCRYVISWVVLQEIISNQSPTEWPKRVKCPVRMSILRDLIFHFSYPTALPHICRAPQISYVTYFPCDYLPAIVAIGAINHRCCPLVVERAVDITLVSLAAHPFCACAVYGKSDIYGISLIRFQ